MKYMVNFNHNTDIIRSIKDPEFPCTLEDLKIVSEDCIDWNSIV